MVRSMSKAWQAVNMHIEDGVICDRNVFVSKMNKQTNYYIDLISYLFRRGRGIRINKNAHTRYVLLQVAATLKIQDL